MAASASAGPALARHGRPVSERAAAFYLQNSAASLAAELDLAPFPGLAPLSLSAQGARSHPVQPKRARGGKGGIGCPDPGSLLATAGPGSLHVQLQCDAMFHGV